MLAECMIISSFYRAWEKLIDFFLPGEQPSWHFFIRPLVLIWLVFTWFAMIISGSGWNLIPTLITTLVSAEILFIIKFYETSRSIIKEMIGGGLDNMYPVLFLTAIMGLGFLYLGLVVM